jgi:hypothetical protein
MVEGYTSTLAKPQLPPWLIVPGSRVLALVLA